MTDRDWIYPEIGRIRSWGPKDLDETSSWHSERTAAYICEDCGSIIPVNFSSLQNGKTLPSLLKHVCPSQFGGCGQVTEQTLVSDGYLWTDNE